MVLRRIESGEDVFTDLNEPLEEMNDQITNIRCPILKSIEKTDLQAKRKPTQKEAYITDFKFESAALRVSVPTKKSLLPAFTLVTLNESFIENVVEARDIDAAIILSGFRTNVLKGI